MDVECAPDQSEHYFADQLAVMLLPALDKLEQSRASQAVQMHLLSWEAGALPPMLEVASTCLLGSQMVLCAALHSTVLSELK